MRFFAKVSIELEEDTVREVSNKYSFHLCGSQIFAKKTLKFLQILVAAGTA